MPGARPEQLAQKAERQEAFLLHFGVLGNIEKSCELVGMPRSQRVYNWRDSDPEFAQRFKEAERKAADLLEHEAYRRAVEGFERPVYQGGKQVGTTTEYSDTLLCRLLEARRPSTWSRKYDVRSQITTTVKLELTEGEQAAIARAYLGLPEDQAVSQLTSGGLDPVATIQEITAFDDEAASLSIEADAE